MKTTLLALLLLCASAAFAQGLGASVISSEPALVHVPSHPARAMQHQLGEERSILFTSANVYAHGERPLWEVSKPAAEVPLGDVARMLRQQHATARKAVMVLEK